MFLIQLHLFFFSDVLGVKTTAVGAARSAEQQHNRQMEALRRQEAAAQEKHAEVAAVHETESSRLQGKRDKIQEMVRGHILRTWFSLILESILIDCFYSGNVCQSFGVGDCQAG